MQTISEITAKAKNRLSSASIESSMSGPAKANQAIDKTKIKAFWKRMAGLFGYKWSGQYGEIPSGEWVMLVNALNEDAINTGIKNMVATSNGWPPTPIEFNFLCSNISLKAMGLPELDEAFNRALSGMYRNAVVEAAARETGRWDLDRGTAADAALKKRFEYNYFEMARRWAKGESLSRPVTKAIEHIQQAASYGVADDLVKQGEERIRATGKTGYTAFLESKKRLKGGSYA